MDTRDITKEMIKIAFQEIREVLDTKEMNEHDKMRKIKSLSSLGIKLFNILEEEEQIND